MNSRGYTLLEVGLFLAITSALLVVALLGLGPRLGNVRFSTGMRDLQANIAKELSISQQGNNSTSAKTGNLRCTTTAGGVLSLANSPNTDKPCVYVGKVALLYTDRVEYRTIVSALDPIIPCGHNPSTYNYIRYCVQARPLPSGSEVFESYDYPAQLKLTNGNVGLGYVRSPENNTTTRFVFNFAGTFSDTATLSSLTITNSEKKACFHSGNRRAALSLKETYDEPKILFNQVGC